MGWVALAASSLATWSLVRFQPTEPRFWRSCSSLRAPMMTLATVGRCNSQFRAICGTVLPVSLATSSIRIHDFVEIFVVDLRAGVGGFVQARDFGDRASAADLPGEARPAKRAPDEGADFLVERERHEFPFVFAADERVIDLMADVTGPAVTLGNRERLHEMPAGKIGAGDVADFAAFDEGVERLAEFLRWE